MLENWFKQKFWTELMVILPLNALMCIKRPVDVIN